MSYILLEWTEFLVRWLHVIAGIAWIGSSFYFIALDLSLLKRKDILIELFFLNNEVNNKILECTTNKDGRVDKPLLTNENFKFGNYQLIFHVKDYFLKNEIVNSNYSFYDKINIDFSINEQSHYHIPLLVSPFGYSTYRGS